MSQNRENAAFPLNEHVSCKAEKQEQSEARIAAQKQESTNIHHEVTVLAKKK